VADGFLDILFHRQRQSPKISAIEVSLLSPSGASSEGGTAQEAKE
jgi:hypothetical protein